MAKLTVKQQRFVDFYDGNGVGTARKAGYKGNDNTLASVAKENLRKPHIIAAIRERQNREDKAKIASRKERQQFWTGMMRDSGIEPKDRLRASELLGKSEADFVDRIDGRFNVNMTHEEMLDRLE